MSSLHIQDDSVEIGKNQNINQSNISRNAPESNIKSKTADEEGIKKTNQIITDLEKKVERNDDESSESRGYELISYLGIAALLALGLIYYLKKK